MVTNLRDVSSIQRGQKKGGNIALLLLAVVTAEAEMEDA